MEPLPRGRAADRTSRRSSATRSGASAARPTPSWRAATSSCVRMRARRGAALPAARRGGRGSRTSAFPTRPWATPTCGSPASAWSTWPLRPTEDEAVVTWIAARAEGGAELPAARTARAGVGARAAHDRVPERRRPHRARLLVPAHATPTTRRPEGELPPVIVQVHGGPTAHATPMLDPEIAFWTSRGIGVVDVNYGGSTGFGRAYRELAQRRLGHRGRGGLRGGRAHLAARGRGRRRAARHPRRQRRRLHHALRARLPRRLRRRRQLLRGGRRRDAGRRHAQVRVALPRRADRPLPGDGRAPTASARRSTTSTGSAPR